MKLLLSLVALFFWVAFLAVVFWLSTTEVFAVEVGSGIWFFAIVLISVLGLLVVWSVADLSHHFFIRIFLLTAVGVLTAASIVLGIRFRPFRLENINFKLGALLGIGGYNDIEYWDLPPAKPEVTMGDLLPEAQDQGYCGNCWAMSAAAMMSARINKNARDAGQSLPLTKRTSCLSSSTDLKYWHASPQAITEADSYVRDSSLNSMVGKCLQGYLTKGLEIARDVGVVPGNCVPLFAGQQSEPGARCNTCDSPESVAPDGKRYCIHGGDGAYRYDKCTSSRSTTLPLVRTRNIRRVRGEEAMKREISANGPITCILNFYTLPGGDRAAWTLIKNGQYVMNINPGFVAKPEMDGEGYTKDNKEGLHQVVVYGYGEAGDGTRYWDVRNSWGKSWGVQGSIKVQRGIDAWNIENSCYTAEVYN